MAIRFTEDDVRPMGRSRGRRARHEAARPATRWSSCDVARDDADHAHRHRRGLRQAHQARASSTRQGRGGQGVKAIKLAADARHVVAAFMVESPDDEVMLISSSGVTIRLVIGTIGHAPLGRDAMGVKVVSLDDGQTVASVALVIQAPETD